MHSNIHIPTTPRDGRLNGGPLATLDAPLLASLMHSRSDTGFISVYEAIDPRDPSRARIHAHDALLRLLRHLAGPDDRIQRVRSAIARTQRALDQLPLRPDGCRAIAGFIDADIDGHGMWIGLDSHVASSVTLDSLPRIEPLVDIHAALAPVGVIRVADDMVVVDSYDSGSIHHAASFRVPPGEGARMKQGPAAHQPQRRGSSSVQEDLFARTMARYELEKIVEWCTSHLPSLAESYRWSEILVWGPLPAAGIVMRVLAPYCETTHAGPALLVHERPALLARRVSAMLDEHAQHHDMHMVRSLVDGTNPDAVVGEPQTVRALDERRVATLVMAVSAQTPDADVHAREAMLRSAASQGSDIMLVHGQAAEMLLAQGGVAAALRY